MQIRRLDGMWNDGDGAAIVFQLGHRQADAFNRDRAFVDSVFLNFSGQFDFQPPVSGVSDAIESDQLSYAVDVALHDVSAETSVGLHWKFEIDQRAVANT